MAGGGNKKAKATTVSEPPEYLQGPLEQAANAASRQYTDPSFQESVFGNLDMQFDRAADLTRGRLDTEFSGAGRNLGASYPARSEELQTLASNIYNPSSLYQYDPTNMYINRLAALIPGAGGTTTTKQPIYKQGLF